MTGSYFISAGEHSGDLLGAELITALGDVYPDLQPFGLCGQAMVEAGGETIEDLHNLSVFGVSQLWTKLHYFRRLEQKILAIIERRRPKFAVLIDYPGLHFRLAEFLKLKNVDVFQYVAPKTWAWGEHRTAALAANFTAVFSIFPFEKKFFCARHVNCHYVGTPHVDRVTALNIPQGLATLGGNAPLIACMPGSRPAEMREHLPIIMEVIADPELASYRFIIPVAANLPLSLITEVTGSQLTPQKCGDLSYYSLGNAFLVHGFSLEVLSLATAAVVASGTVTLECALLQVPTVVFYRTSPLTYALAKDNIDVSWISLSNILRGKKVVPEYIQDFSPADIVLSLRRLLEDKDEVNYQLAEYKALAASLKNAVPTRTAELIYNYMH